MRELIRTLGLPSVVAISLSAMLGSGIFVLPGLAYEQTGPSAWLCYLLAAVAILPAVLSKSELATAMPASGGTYIYLERTFGPLAGTISGLGLLFTLLLKSSFALVGFGAYLSVLTNIDIKVVAMALLAVILVLNYLGVGKVSKALIVFVTLTIAGLIYLTAKASFIFNPEYFEPFMTNGYEGLFSTTALVFVSYAGVTNAAALAEEIHHPEKNLPLGILISFFIVAIIYCVVNFVLAGSLPAHKLSGDLRSLTTLAQLVQGNTLGIIFAALGILTMGSMANAGILAASRFPFAMARDNLLPSMLGRLNNKFLTPSRSILLSGIFVAIAILFLDIASIAKLASAFLIFTFMLENICVIVLRETRVQWYKPVFLSPFYPLMQVFGIIACLALLTALGWLSVLAILSIAIPGIVIFFIYGNKRVTRKGVVGIRGKRKDLIEESNINFITGSNITPIDLSSKMEICVSLIGKERSPETLIEMAASLTGGQKLEVAFLIEIPEQTGVNDLRDEFSTVKSLRRRVLAMEEVKKIPIKFDVVVSHDILKTIHGLSQRLDCHWLFIEWEGKTGNAFTLNNPVIWLRDHLSCNLVVFRDVGVRYIRKIMVLIHDYGTEEVIINLADQIGTVNNAFITLVRYIHSSEQDNIVESEKSILSKCKDFCKSPTDIKIIRGKNKLETILAATADFDLLVLGDFKSNNMYEQLFGSFYDRLISKAACNVLCTQKYVYHQTHSIKRT